MNDRRFSWGIREKLTLLFFGVTFIAVATNFLIVVPRLEAQLRGNRVDEMEHTAQRYGSLLQLYEQQVDTELTSTVAVAQFLDNNKLQEISGARVAIFKPRQTSFPLEPQLEVFADTSGLLKQSEPATDWIASRIIASGQTASGTVEVAGQEHAQAGVPITSNGRVVGAGMFSTTLGPVDSIVKQQARRYLVAAVFALGLALIVGVAASSFIARRIERLERAARQVSDGNFTEPLVVDSADELGQLAQAFNNMQERLGRADRARKAFIANASHELRTPLFSLGGYVELLREEELDEQTQREFLDIMHEQIRRLTQLATDLLDLSKIDTGSLDVKPEQTDVKDLAEAMAREFEPRAARKEAEIAVDVPSGVTAYCDPDRLAQVVRILIDNALSHTPQGTNIRVAAEPSNGAVRVQVSDDGPGIPREDLPRIFERFHTGDKTGGTGLGLSIANELASAMNGSLSVSSKPGETIFSLDLPAAGSG
ncbi:MAG: HAMP domain-containing histidine kinase [Actinobacteria bacterium]|nr:HAMP domain-containing histidine kinase [Actinomycetota bacterium]